MEALKGNYVLGAILPNPNQPSFELLASQLRTRYIANYLDIWESVDC